MKFSKLLASAKEHLDFGRSNSATQNRSQVNTQAQQQFSSAVRTQPGARVQQRPPSPVRVPSPPQTAATDLMARYGIYCPPLESYVEPQSPLRNFSVFQRNLEQATVQENCQILRSNPNLYNAAASLVINVIRQNPNYVAQAYAYQRRKAGLELNDDMADQAFIFTTQQIKNIMSMEFQKMASHTYSSAIQASTGLQFGVCMNTERVGAELGWLGRPLP